MSRQKENLRILGGPLFSNSLDYGTTAFMKWLCSENKDSPENRIMVKDYSNIHIILYDRGFAKHILVVNVEGIPVCKNCNSDDCSHIGFAICLKQYRDHIGII